MIWRYVHAQRARKLRRRGEVVWFDGFEPTGRAIYAWKMRIEGEK